MNSVKKLYFYPDFLFLQIKCYFFITPTEFECLQFGTSKSVYSKPLCRINDQWRKCFESFQKVSFQTSFGLFKFTLIFWRKEKITTESQVELPPNKLWTILSTKPILKTNDFVEFWKEFRYVDFFCH